MTKPKSRQVPAIVTERIRARLKDGRRETTRGIAQALEIPEITVYCGLRRLQSLGVVHNPASVRLRTLRGPRTAVLWELVSELQPEPDGLPSGIVERAIAMRPELLTVWMGRAGAQPYDPADPLSQGY